MEELKLRSDDGEVSALYRRVEESRMLVVLGHGAGSHLRHKTISGLEELVSGCGASTLRFNFRYRELGRSMPDRMPRLIAQYRDIVRQARELWHPTLLVIGGHSMGGRVASMLAAEGEEVDGLLLFGYPLHPAGSPEKLRIAHLADIKTPVLLVSGTEDALCDRALMEESLNVLDRKLWLMNWVEKADHSLVVKKSSGRDQGAVDAEIGSSVCSWLGALYADRSSTAGR